VGLILPDGLRSCEVLALQFGDLQLPDESRVKRTRSAYCPCVPNCPTLAGLPGILDAGSNASTGRLIDVAKQLDRTAIAEK
jgi:hypothetical protein